MLVAALIWGSAFVAQRLSLDAIGPFLFTGFRFLLGACVVIVLIAYLKRRRQSDRTDNPPANDGRAVIVPGIVLGVLLSVAISAQQIGLRYTLIANAGFISSLYVVIVPLMGLLARHQTHNGTLAGAVLVAIGLYFLSVSEHFSVHYGDSYQLVGAIVIAAQVMLVGRFARRHDPLMLALIQFVTCGVICLTIGVVIEPLDLATLQRAAPTLLYGGVLSVGIAYTIQVVAQKDAAPSHAAVIFSMEGVFAALAGWLVLGETLTARAMFGCALMLAGLIVCQVAPAWANRRQPASLR